MHRVVRRRAPPDRVSDEPRSVSVVPEAPPWPKEGYSAGNVHLSCAPAFPRSRRGQPPPEHALRGSQRRQALLAISLKKACPAGTTVGLLAATVR